MAGLLQRRFGSTTRVDRARAELRNIKQGQAESVRSYSTRFEALLSKLPSFDSEWAKTQFIWGLTQRVAELVVIAKPGDLHAAINQAEHIEMARNFTSGNIPGQKTGTPFRGRGGFMRGRGRFNAVQASGSSSQLTEQGVPQFAAQQQYSCSSASMETRINARDVKGTDIGRINAHLIDKAIVVAEDPPLVGDLDVEEEVDNLCSVVAEEELEILNQSMPLWSRPDQELLHRHHRCRKLPQCPCLQGRETNCAPSWPMQSAGGEVRAP